MMRRPLTTLISTLGIATLVQADTLDVVPGESIQAAIDAASDGDDIVVAPGFYNELLNLHGKEIYLHSAYGPGKTTIDGSGLDGSTILCDSGETPDTVIEGFTISGGTGTLVAADRRGGGMYIRMCSPVVRNCVFRDNVAHGGGGLMTYFSGATIEDCTFSDNLAESGLITTGGGGMMNRGGAPSIVNCMFSNNAADVSGGGVRNLYAHPDVVNCAFVENTALTGGALMNVYSSAAIVNCTMTGNHATAIAGAVWSISNSSVTMANSIVWDNTSGDNTPGLVDAADSTTTVHHSIVAGGWSGTGSDILDTDPMLGDDLTPSDNSPAIDAGDNDAYDQTNGPDVDLAGMPRMVSASSSSGPASAAALVDLGVFEWQADPAESTGPTSDPEASCPGDVNGDSAVDIDDLISIVSGWGSDDPTLDANGDGAVNVDDIWTVMDNWGFCDV